MRGLVLFNHRQRALLSHALRHPNQHYTIKGHKNSHNVTYQTARVDLLELEKRQILVSVKVRRELLFTALDDLEHRLRNLG